MVTSGHECDGGRERHALKQRSGLLVTVCPGFSQFCIYVCTAFPLRIGLLNWPVRYPDHGKCIYHGYVRPV